MVDLTGQAPGAGYRAMAPRVTAQRPPTPCDSPRSRDTASDAGRSPVAVSLGTAMPLCGHEPNCTAAPVDTRLELVRMDTRGEGRLSPLPVALAMPALPSPLLCSGPVARVAPGNGAFLCIFHGSAGSIPSCQNRKLHTSASSSTTFVTGRPAPWPARDSTLSRIGRSSAAVAFCNRAANLRA